MREIGIVRNKDIAKMDFPHLIEFRFQILSYIGRNCYCWEKDV